MGLSTKVTKASNLQPEALLVLIAKKHELLTDHQWDNRN